MKKKLPLLLLLLFGSFFSNGQTINKLRPLESLINKEDPGWPIVLDWIKKGSNKIEILPKNKIKADSALYKSQVTTRSPMGAIVYESGGILINDGYIRILGSGNTKLDRNLMDWNNGKSFSKPGEQPSFLLIADDLMGGFFAINAGEFGQNDIGKVFYSSPFSLNWESLGITYSEFLVFCFSGDLKKFYKNFQWAGWENETKNIDGNHSLTFFPFLSTKEGKNINKVSRKSVPIEEIWSVFYGYK